MPVQTQMSSFANKLGARVAGAHAEHKDKPVDTGNQRLPSGIRNGIAKLSSLYTKEYADGEFKGNTFFRASAIVMSPESHNGEKVAGAVTSVIIGLCDIPAKGQRKAKTFADQWYEFQNFFKKLGINPPDEHGNDEAAGRRIEAYYMAAMKMLADAQRPPTYINFSTRGWTPPKTATQPNPTEMVFEEWHGRAEWNGQHNPAAGVTESPAATQPAPFSQPPAAEPFNEFTPQVPAPAQVDPADEVSAMLEIAMNDPEGATEDGAVATRRLEELAWAAGATEEQTKNAADWAAVAEMALGVLPSPQTGAPSQASGLIIPPVGAKRKFAKRTKDGAKLKNAKGEEFPPQDVEVTSVDAANKTCTVKSTRDGKDVVDIRTKKPIAVKFEWLE